MSSPPANEGVPETATEVAPGINPERYAGKVAVVTGGGAGIGRAVALLLAQEGARVVVVDIDPNAGLQTVAAIKAAGAFGREHVVDLSDRSARDLLVPAVLDREGRVDLWVNNAAWTGLRVPFLDIDYEDWDKVMETNVSATAFLARAAAVHMIERGSGAIVNVTSIQQQMPVPTYGPYVASKGAIAALTRAMAVELSAKGVRVNAVEPGVIATSSFQETLVEAGQVTEGQLPPSPTLLMRPGHPFEVARAVSFLCSQEASFITGAILAVDGGRRLSRMPDAFDAGFRDYPYPRKP